MLWNWELPDWPRFTYESVRIALHEREFLLEVGSAFGLLKTLSEKDYNQFVVEILTLEGLESSRIEGEVLDKQSLQSAIARNLRFSSARVKAVSKESRMAKLLCNVYATFDKPLTHEMLWQWHAQLFDGQSHIDDSGKYRTHAEPMQIVSGRVGNPKVFFEAPPSSRVLDEMTAFIHWFNASNASEPVLGRAAIAHVYFESIHPFEDGNGRIGRLLVEKVLSQAVSRPILIAVSKVLEKGRKDYYAALERCNRTLSVAEWVEYFARAILQAQEESVGLLYFLIEKSKMFTALTGQLNPRQEKVLLRLFAEGLSGFKGDLSAENYISITKASRATATRDLADLVEKGALIKTGELRHTRYRLNLQRLSKG